MAAPWNAPRTAEGRRVQAENRARMTREKGRLFPARRRLPPPDDAEAERLVAEFLARGGRVTMLSPGDVRGDNGLPDRPLTAVGDPIG